MRHLLATLRSIVGERAVLTGPDLEGRTVGGMAPEPLGVTAIVRPGTTEEVAAVLMACNEVGVGVVPVGGNTGLVGATQGTPDQIQLSLERMRSIEAIDSVGRTMTVQCGAVLQAVQQAAAVEGLVFPVDLGARGTAQVGGLIGTNAGGNGVIRFGMMRENVLGVEAVLPDGRLISSMHAVVKNNTGYDIKQLLIGSEGTLGVVTRAVLRLRPAPVSRNTALLAVPSFDSLGRLLTRLEAKLGGSLTAFEAMWQSFYRLVAIESGNHAPPLPGDSPFYALVESHEGEPRGVDDRFHRVIGDLHGEGLVSDAVIAMSDADRERLWHIRDDVPALISALDGRFAYDVSLPIGDMQAYLATVEHEIQATFGDHRFVVFGHLGDGNIHLTLRLGDHIVDGKDGVDQIVYNALLPYRGSLSAEHGIGTSKRPYLDRTRTAEEIALMHSIKAIFDPNGIMNPGKVL